MFLDVNTPRWMRILLNTLITEFFPLVERQGFQKTPFVNGNFGYINHVIGYDYQFYKLSAPYIISLEFWTNYRNPYASVIYQVYRITDMPEALEELNGHYGFFQEYPKSVRRIMHRWSPYRVYTLPYSTPFEFMRQHKISRLRNQMSSDLSDMNTLFDRYMKKMKRQSEKILVCDRYGVLSKIPDQEAEVRLQLLRYGLNDDSEWYNENVSSYGLYFGIKTGEDANE